MADSKTPAITSPDPLTRLFSSPTDRTITRLNRILSTSAGVDSTLLLLGYSLTFTSAQLTRLATANITSLASTLALRASATLKPGETRIVAAPVPAPTARIVALAAQAKVVSGMCSDVRCAMRLWGLLKIWAGAKATYAAPPKDALLRVLAWGQLGAMGAYLVMEHGFYLASKGVLRGWSPEKIGRWFRGSIAVFGAYLVLDFVRLARTSNLASKPLREKSMEEVHADKVKEAAWWRSLQVDLAYSPLCFQWGMVGGVGMSDAWVGALGAWAGWTGFKEQWRIAGL